jgi:hypothetical protein
MKTTIVSITAFMVFTFYVALIAIAMIIEIGMLAYIFIPAILRKLKSKEITSQNNSQLSYN